MFCRKPQQSPEDTRNNLLLAALRLFAQKGFVNTSTREIAAQARANIGSIAYYFGDKQGLYRAVFDEMPTKLKMQALLPEKVEQLRDQALDQVLEVFYQDFTEHLCGHPDAKACIDLWYRETLEPTGIWSDYVAQRIRPKNDMLQHVIARELGVPVDADVVRLAHMVASLGVYLFSCQDVLKSLSPQLIDTPEAVKTMRDRMVHYAKAMVSAEKQRRLDAKEESSFAKGMNNLTI